MKRIWTVDALDFPEELNEYCAEHDIETHYQNDIVDVIDDGNPFSEWLKTQGFKFKKNDLSWVGIFTT